MRDLTMSEKEKLQQTTMKSKLGRKNLTTKHGDGVRKRGGDAGSWW